LWLLAKEQHKAELQSAPPSKQEGAANG
jgi:hypothetical protein